MYRISERLIPTSKLGRGGPCRQSSVFNSGGEDINSLSLFFNSKHHGINFVYREERI